MPRDLFLGETTEGEAIGLSPKDRRNHIHIVGASNQGKSKFMENLIRADLDNPDVGAFVLDPHGLLVDDILLWVSHDAPYLSDRVVLFEPAADTEQVSGFNPIPRSYDSLSATVYSIIDSILYAWGQGDDVFPRLRPQLFNVLQPVLANKLTLVEALAMFSPHHKAERAILLEGIDEPNVRASWEVLNKVSNTEEYRLLEGVINRFSALLNSEYMRRILSVEENAIDMARVMAEKKILLVSLRSHNRIHPDNLRMLGTMLLSEVYRVGMLRNEQDEPPPFHVYIDEFGQYTTPKVASMLDEIRKRSVYLTVAHQHLAQLLKNDNGTELLSSVMTNCLIRVAFGGLTPNDADLMTRRMWTPHINLKEIKHRQFATKTRHIEETRKSVTQGRSVSDGKTHTESEGSNWSHGTSQGRSEAVTSSKTKGVSEGSSQSTTEGSSESENWSKGESHSDTSGNSLTKSSSRTTGTSSQNSRTTGSSDTTSKAETKGASSSSSSSESGGSSSSSTEGRSEGHNVSFVPDGPTTRAVHNLTDGTSTASTHSTNSSYSHSSSESEHHSRTEGKSHTDSRSVTKGGGSSSAETKGMNHSVTRSATDGTNSNEGGSRSMSSGQSRGRNRGTNRSESQGTTHSDTHTRTHSEGGSKGSSQGTSHTETDSESETTTGRLRYGAKSYAKLPARVFRFPAARLSARHIGRASRV